MGELSGFDDHWFNRCQQAEARADRLAQVVIKARRVVELMGHDSTLLDVATLDLSNSIIALRDEDL